MLAALFELDDLGERNDPRYNIAPQTRILTVRGAKAGRMAQSLLWGAPNPRGPRPLINARAETVATSPLFSPAFLRSRVLVPADGFYEWTKEGGRRQAHYFQQEGGGPFAFAGIAVEPAASSNLREPAAVILTTEATESVRAIHHRMPLIVARDDFEAWLGNTGPNDPMAVLAAGTRTSWTSRSVGPTVNNVRHDGPDCIRPEPHTPDRQRNLF